MRHGSVPLIVALLASAAVSDATVIDFDNFQDQTMVNSQIAGLLFSNTQVFTAGVSLNEFEFPPHSGTNVAVDSGGPISIDFSSPIQSISGYFTYTTRLTLTAFDRSGLPVAAVMSQFSNNLACLAGPPCSGDPGSTPNERLTLISPAGITRVVESGDPAGSSFAMDDVMISASPEPAAAGLMISAALIIWLAKSQCLRRYR